MLARRSRWPWSGKGVGAAAGPNPARLALGARGLVGSGGAARSRVPAGRAPLRLPRRREDPMRLARLTILATLAARCARATSGEGLSHRDSGGDTRGTERRQSRRPAQGAAGPRLRRRAKPGHRISVGGWSRRPVPGPRPYPNRINLNPIEIDDQPVESGHRWLGWAWHRKTGDCSRASGTASVAGCGGESGPRFASAIDSA